MNIHQLLAKSPNNGGDSLAKHTMDVVERLGQLKKRLPYLAQDINLPELWEIMFAAAWLHDFGKVADGFQKVLRGEVQAWGFRHEVLSLGFLEWFFERGSEPFRIGASVIASHHKDFSILQEQYLHDFTMSGVQERWLTEINEGCIEELSRWTKEKYYLAANAIGIKTPLPFMDFKVSNTFQDGVEIIQESLKQFEILFNLQANKRQNKKRDDRFLNRKQAITIRGLMLQADRLASSGAPPLKVFELLGVLEKMSIVEKWYDHQKQSSQTKGNVLLKAPTGSGKTEAALLWAIKQKQTDPISAVFYILPFRASINAMYQRFCDVYQVPQEDIALMHSKSIQVFYQQLTEYNEIGPYKAYVISKQRRSFAKLHQQPICIGTPYQLLRAGFRLSGYEGQWVMFKNSLIIIDEIHGYEPKRIGMLLAFFKTLQEDWNVQFYCMTATMPKWLEDTIVSQLKIKDNNVLQSSNSLFEDFKRHKLFIRSGKINDQFVISEIVNKYNESKDQNVILVVCNKIKIAQQVASELRKCINESVEVSKNIEVSKVLLLHSRYSVEDRSRRESILKERILKARKFGEGLIVVGTQVVEVSLDVDFDTIYTEPAPLEALLQRIGRVNRHRWHKEGIKPVYVLDNTDDWEFPYQQEGLMRRTISLLKQFDKLTINEALVTTWLNELYEPEVERLLSEIAEGERIYEDIGGKEKLIAFQSDREVKREFYDLFDGYEVLPDINYKDFITLIDSKNFLKAFSLCVPISSKQFYSIKKKCLLEDWHVWKVDCYYDSIIGLDIAQEINKNHLLTD